MSKIWLYFAPLWQGDDNKISLKRILVIVLAIEVVRMIERDKITSDQTLSAFYAILGTICVTLGIVTFAQLQAAKLPMFTKTTTSEVKVTSTTDKTTLAPE